MNPQEPAMSEQKPSEIDSPIESPSSSMILTMNRLRETEDRLYQLKHKLDIIHSKQCKVFNKSLQNERKQNFYEEISEFANQEKTRLYKNLCLRRDQIEQSKKLNSERRSNHNEIMKMHRETSFEKNKYLSQEALRCKQKYKRLIKTNEQKQYSRRKALRDRVYHSSRQGQAYVKEFLLNKNLNNFLSQEQRKHEANERISENEEAIESYMRVNEGARGQLMELIEESRVRPAEERAKRNFRVKYQSRNQTTFILQ